MEKTETEIREFVIDTVGAREAYGIRVPSERRITEVAKTLELRGLLVLRYGPHVLVVAGAGVRYHLTQTLYEREWRKGWDDCEGPVIAGGVLACIEKVILRENMLRPQKLWVSEVFPTENANRRRVSGEATA